MLTFLNSLKRCSLRGFLHGSKQNKKIIGINIDSYTFLMNQLADDTCMFLDGTEESLKACLDLYNDFNKCSI